MVSKENRLLPPYWAKLWPSAIAMANFLIANESLLHHKKVLEIGAGLALPSIIAAKMAQLVYCTDISEEAIDLANQNKAFLGIGNMHCALLDWNHYQDAPEVDVILLSDINYQPEAFTQLTSLRHYFLEKGCTILLSTPQRLLSVPFINDCLPFCQLQTIVSVPVSNQLQDISVLLLKK